ncbi:MAG: 3-oxoacyl-ACP reductase FabG [Burkholderiaceae bacterium]|nr:3-oxoacyl-ACP reductase FabG [Burkholderiaceae bacterium]
MSETVLVTGANRGIGRAIALRLARDGYDLWLHHRGRDEAIADLVREIAAAGRRAVVLAFDVTDRTAAAQALAQAVAQHGAPYGVVCNAGITRDGVFPALSGEDWDAVLRTNLDGFFNVVHPLLMPMVRRRAPGRIVTIASLAGQIGNRGQVNYSASKAGLIGATKALATELASRNITVNCVAPGLIETDMTRGLDLAELLKHVPAGRAGKPEEVAAVVSFLMSPDAAYITRQVIGVNGGVFG